MHFPVSKGSSPSLTTQQDREPKNPTTSCRLTKKRKRQQINRLVWTVSHDDIVNETN